MISGLLPLLHALDGETELLAQLVVIVVVEVSDPAVQADDGLHHAELILARRVLIIDERALQLLGNPDIAAGGKRSLFPLLHNWFRPSLLFSSRKLTQ